jgi:diguanylate cyclase (GGDEF)-like protein
MIDLLRYKSEFTIFICDRDVMSAQMSAEIALAAGYSQTRWFPSSELMLAMMRVDLPHVAVIEADRVDSVTEALVSQIKAISEEIQIIVLTSAQGSLGALQLVTRGLAYDCITRPMASTLELTLAIDRAVRTLYFQFAMEQKPNGSAQSTNSSQEIEAEHEIHRVSAESEMLLEATQLSRRFLRSFDYETLTLSLLESVSRQAGGAPSVYFRYLPMHASLLITQSCWLSSERTRNIGLDLRHLETDALQACLHQPEHFSELKHLMRDVFGCDRYTVRVHRCDSEVIGFSVVFDRLSASDVEKLEILHVEFEAAWKRVTLQKDRAQFDLFDRATGVLNSKHLRSQIDIEISRARAISQSVSLIVVRLDRHVELLQQIGHDRFDSVLRATAGLLQQLLAPYEKIGRCGQAEFAIVLPHISSESALERAKIFRRVIDNAAIPVLQTELVDERSVSISSGVTDYPHLAQDADSLLRSADLALDHVSKLPNQICRANVGSRFQADFEVKVASAAVNELSFDL